MEASIFFFLQISELHNQHWKMSQNLEDGGLGYVADAPKPSEEDAQMRDAIARVNTGVAEVSSSFVAGVLPGVAVLEAIRLSYGAGVMKIRPFHKILKDKGLDLSYDAYNSIASSIKKLIKDYPAEFEKTSQFDEAGMRKAFGALSLKVNMGSKNSLVVSMRAKVRL